MAIETKLAIFKEKYLLSEEAIGELKAIFDSIIVEFTHKIINTESAKTFPKLDTSRVIHTEKKFATKIAELYASECNVTLEEIPSKTGKVTKKEIENYVKNKTGLKSKKSKNPKDEQETKLKFTSKTDIETEAETDTEVKESKKNRYKTDFESEAEIEVETKKSVSKKEKIDTKEKCKGITKEGNPCNLNATKNPDGSKKCYCFRHALDWKQYEVSSDSDYEKDEDKKIHEDLDEVND